MRERLQNNIFIYIPNNRGKGARAQAKWYQGFEANMPVIDLAPEVMLSKIMTKLNVGCDGTRGTAAIKENIQHYSLSYDTNLKHFTDYWIHITLKTLLLRVYLL